MPCRVSVETENSNDPSLTYASVLGRVSSSMPSQLLQVSSPRHKEIDLTSIGDCTYHVDLIDNTADGQRIINAAVSILLRNPWPITSEMVKEIPFRVSSTEAAERSRDRGFKL